MAMIKTKIINNFLPVDLLTRTYHYCLYECPHYLNQSSTETSPKFYSCDLNFEHSLIKLIINKIKTVSNYNIIRAYLNIQYHGMSGDWHTDDGDITILYMLSPTLKKEEGCFEIKNEKKINFVQNKLIIFDAKKVHKGNDPKGKKARITMAFKMKT
tara:strand:+ start:206 stop:673 length:468 start_codon:yes stop_codon:yes gene_type:complete